MSDDETPDFFEEGQARKQQLQELARQFREGSDVPMEERLKKLQELTSEINRERPRSRQTDKERMLESLRAKHGDLPRKALWEKGFETLIGEFRAFEQEMQRPTPQDLHEAILLGDILQVQRLLSEGVDIQGAGATGSSPLTAAVIHKQWEIVRLLREAGAEIGLTEAVALEDLDAIESLLDQGADINTRDKTFGATLLQTAVRQQNKEMVRLLLARGADVNDGGKRGFTPLMTAALQKEAEMIDLLLAAGASVGVIEASLLGDQDRLLSLLDAGAVAGQVKKHQFRSFEIASLRFSPVARLKRAAN